MPELPEVETIRNDLREHVIDLPITDVEVRRDSMVRGDTTAFISVLRNNRICVIDRVGKLIICKLGDTDRYLLIHLKMTGQLIYVREGELIAGGHTEPPIEEQMPNRFSYVIVSFADGSTLYFNDMRTFGYMDIVDGSEKYRIVKQFGIEPLTEQFTFDAFRTLFHDRKTSVKALLLNQRHIAGIGNIYADEICFAAGIRPDRKSESLTEVELEMLYRKTDEIIARAVEERGTTFNSYRDPKGRKGNFLKHLKVYGRAGSLCITCGTALTRTKIAGRGTVYCSRCQS